MPTHPILPPYLAGRLALKAFDPHQERVEQKRAKGQAVEDAEHPVSADRLVAEPNTQLLLCRQVPRERGQALLRRLACAPQKPHLTTNAFSTGDRFTEIYGSFAQKPVWVVQCAVGGPELTEALTDAMQALWAGRHAESRRDATLFLPSELDPQLYPTDLNRLVARLAKVSGAQRICYMPELCDEEAPALHTQRASQVLSAQRTALRQAAQHPGVKQAPSPAAAEAGVVEAILQMSESQAKHWHRRRARATAPSDLIGAALHWEALSSEAQTQLDKAYVAEAAEAQAAERRGEAPIKPWIENKQQAAYVVMGTHTGTPLPAALAAEVAQRGAPVQHGEHTFDAHRGAVELAAGVSLAGRHVVVVTNTRSMPEPPGANASSSATVPTWEALLLVQKARDAGAAAITVVQAYQMNGRSDRKFDRSVDQSHFPPYAALVSAWFKGLKVDRQILVEAHDMHTQSMAFDAKREAVGEVGGMEILLQHQMATLTPAQRAHAVLAWPDAGSRRRGADMERAFADRPRPRPVSEPADYAKRVVVCDKVHNAGHDTGVQLSSSGGRIDPDADVFLADDEVGSGGTLAGAIALLRARGAGTGEGKLHALITHNNLPTQVAQRNLLYAWFRSSGAHGLSFLDTQPTGLVVGSYAELRALGVDESTLDKFCAARGITDWTPDRLEGLFSGLRDFVRVVSAAPQVADKLLP